MIMSSKLKAKATITPRRSSRAITGSSAADVNENETIARFLFPKECFICGKLRIQRAKKNIYPKLLTTNNAQITIKEASKDKMPAFYFQNQEVDLIANELQFHESCYNTFTHGYSGAYRESLNTTSDVSSIPAEIQSQGDFDSVQRYT